MRDLDAAFTLVHQEVVAGLNSVTAFVFDWDRQRVQSISIFCCSLYTDERGGGFTQKEFVGVSVQYNLKL